MECHGRSLLEGSVLSALASRKEGGVGVLPSGRGEHTGIELAAIRLQCALVVNVDLVTALRLSVALDGQSHVDLELFLGQHANGGGGKEREGQEGELHLVWW